MRGVQIENRPAVEVIRRFNYPNVLIYADPPYLLSARYGKQYRCEMSQDDHIELLDTLRSHTGKVLISGYESHLYDLILPDWRKETIEVMAQTATKRTEVLWMNFDPPWRNLSLFEEEL